MSLRLERRRSETEGQEMKAPWRLAWSVSSGSFAIKGLLLRSSATYRSIDWTF